MRLATLRSLLFGALVVLAVGVFPGCENPLSPLNKSDKIQGLTYIEAQTTWTAWDTDPEADGVEIALTYLTEFGDSLKFHDKPHNVVIEFWTQKDIGTETSSYLTQDQLFFSKTVEYSNSEDDIRISVEAYSALIPAAAFDEDSGEANQVFVLVRVFPPKEYPRKELYIAESDVTIFKPVVAEGTQNF